MKIRSKKGFTLIELIIAIAIISTVLIIGYRILDKSQIFSNEQRQINNIQLGINNLRKYITEDLKKSDNFTYPSLDNMSMDYSYRVSKEDGTIEYKVEYKNKGKNKFYTIKRINGEQEISFIENQPVKESSLDEHNPPLIIDYDNTKKVYSVKLDYGRLDADLYTFDIYNGDIQVVGGIEVPEIPSGSKGGNLIKQCIIQVNMLIKQIQYEARGNSFDKEIQPCLDYSKYIIDNFDDLWQNKDLLELEIMKITNAIESLYNKVDNGNSQHKIDIRYYIKLSNEYISKSIYILKNQNYYDAIPDLTVSLIQNFSLNSSVNSNYYVSLKNIKNTSLQGIIRNGTFEKLNSYLNTDGIAKVRDLQTKISYMQTNSSKDENYIKYESIDSINNYYLQPMYHPYLDTSQMKKDNFSQEIKKLINRLEYYRDTEVSELLHKEGSGYKYFNNLNDQNIPCAETIISNIKQSITIIIEEFKYISYGMGIEID